MGQHAAPQVRGELALDIPGQSSPFGIGRPHLGMSRALLLVAVLCVGCERERAADKVREMVPDKVKSAVDKVDKTLDKLDTDELDEHVKNAQAMIARG
jgi:hypothetical protein